MPTKLKELQYEVDQEKTRANEIQIHANKDLEALTRQYEEKLREVVQQTKEHDNQVCVSVCVLLGFSVGFFFVVFIWEGGGGG